jgi:hypothetical protein
MIHLLRNPQKIERRTMAPRMNVEPTTEAPAEVVTLSEFRQRTQGTCNLTRLAR